jgi:hypothetical protein
MAATIGGKLLKSNPLNNKIESIFNTVRIADVNLIWIVPG